MSKSSNYTVENFYGNYLIKENKTEQYLVSYDHRMPANALCRKLNAGSGFEGETPSFMTKNILRVNVRETRNYE